MVKSKIEGLVKKKHIFLTESGDHSIRYALKLIKSLDRRLIIQDEGGWITYPQLANRFKIPLTRIETEYGLIKAQDLMGNNESVLLINSLPGYHALQKMRPLVDAGTKYNILIINDVSGSIGTDQASLGDIILGSFGNAKPINLKKGGFLATDNDDYASFFKDLVGPSVIDKHAFDKEINRLDGKIAHYKKLRQSILQDLKEYEIIHPTGVGINVLVKFNSEEEKNHIVSYCNEHQYEFEVCPRPNAAYQIRTNKPAVSIELKRIQDW